MSAGAAALDHQDLGRGALEHLLQRIPAAVLADQIGMSPWTGQKWASLAAPDYARYVARRHKQDFVGAGRVRIRP